MHDHVFWGNTERADACTKRWVVQCSCLRADAIGAAVMFVGAVAIAWWWLHAGTAAAWHALRARRDCCQVPTAQSTRHVRCLMEACVVLTESSCG